MTKITLQYLEKHPCPQCGSHNVGIQIDAIGGREWCNDCRRKRITNTFNPGE